MRDYYINRYRSNVCFLPGWIDYKETESQHRNSGYPVSYSRNGNYTLDGYMTVEATLLLPVVFFITILLIYIGLYMYDDCIIKQDNARMIIRMGQIKWTDDDNIIRRFNEYENEWYYDKYVAFVKDSRDLDISSSGFVVNEKAHLKVPRMFPFDTNEWNLADSIESARFEVVRILRDLRKVKNNGRSYALQDNG